MISISQFVKRTPAKLLNDFFDLHDIPVNGYLKPPIRSAAINDMKDIIGRAPEPTQSKLAKAMERVAAMADDAGQVALLEVCKDPGKLADLENGFARAAWLLLNEPDAFRHAEEARFTDEHRRGRKWSGFVTKPKLSVRQSYESLESFKEAVRDCLECRNVHIDLFKRHREGVKDDETFEIVQVTIYQEGRLDDFPEFVDGKLDWRSRRPVYEAALTYEPDTGVIEVVGANRDTREELADLFAEELLGDGSGQKRLPFRQYNLDVLLRPYDFPTDPEDGIESVRVSQLRLMPLDTAGERVIFECSRAAEHTIWKMAADHFGNNDPLQSGWLVTKAKLLIRFHPDPGSRRGKTLPLTVTMPHGCDLKDRTEHERIVGEKYLRRWRMLKDV